MANSPEHKVDWDEDKAFATEFAHLLFEPRLLIVVIVHVCIVHAFDVVFGKHKVYHVIQDNPAVIDTKWDHKETIPVDLLVSKVHVFPLSLGKRLFVSESIPFQVPHGDLGKEMEGEAAHLIKRMKHHLILKCSNCNP